MLHVSFIQQLNNKLVCDLFSKTLLATPAGHRHQIVKALSLH